MLWTSNSFQRVSRFTCDGTCGSKCCRFCGSFLRCFLKASLVSVLWAAYLFFSGDWYVCCMSHLSNRTEEAQLPCKDKWKLTIEERLRITELNNESRVSGIFFLFHMFEPVILTQQYECILFLFQRVSYFLLKFVNGATALISLINWRKCCKKISSCFDRRKTYYKLILEEEGLVRKDLLRKKAKEKLTDFLKTMIEEGQWEKCFNAAEELIKREENSPFELEEVGTVQFQVNAL